jgi:tryptophan 7-halogenase
VDQGPVRSVLIVGGGTAGWMTASTLSRFFPSERLSITVVESEEIGIVGVGEATVPLLLQLHGLLGIDEREFLKATNGTYKLGIEFRDWGRIGGVFFHGFGDYGADIQGVQPHHHWVKLHQLGDPTSLDDYSLPYAIGRRGRFAIPPPGTDSPASFFRYAFHFDASLYGRFLRSYAEANGVTRVEGKIVDVALRGDDGFIEGVTLADGRQHSADLYVDCSGFRGLLIEQALQTGYEDWRRCLPCDSALAVPSEVVAAPTPFTRSTAQKAGWQWRIPLQHRIGNGHVYSSAFISDDEARDILLANLDGKALAEPRQLRFVAGRRKQAWNRNCVAIGLAAGFMEPLESTSIQLIQTAAVRLVEYFPDLRFDPAMIAEYNRVTANESERIRDFLVLHYCLTQRTDSDFWRHCAEMELPDSLKHTIEVFGASGKLPSHTEESYQDPSWVAIFVGNGFLPKRYDALVDNIPVDQLRQLFAQRRAELARIAESMPTHEAFIARFAQAQAA